MRQSIIITILISFFFACNSKKNEYESNLETFQNVISEINQYFIDDSKSNINIDKYYTENFIFYSYPAGYKKGVSTSKIDYINGFNEMKKMNISINIDHSIYLPGIDEKSHKIDGSVRVYYGAIMSIDTNHVGFSGYQTVNFSEGKISAIWEWADYGGVNNEIMK
tara:strand:- start:149 stop:643 length:495 start_codon:yes stop_codon:yes gene_type:complete